MNSIVLIALTYSVFLHTPPQRPFGLPDVMNAILFYMSVKRRFPFTPCYKLGGSNISVLKQSGWAIDFPYGKIMKANFSQSRSTHLKKFRNSQGRQVIRWLRVAAGNNLIYDKVAILCMPVDAITYL